MKTKKFSGEIKTFDNKPLSSYTGKDGNPLPASVPYHASANQYDSYSEIAEKDKPKEKDIVRWMNQDEVSKQRAKAIADVISDLGLEKPKFEDDKLAQLKTVYRGAIAAGRSEKEAREGAEMLTGHKWADYEKTPATV